MQKLHNKNLIVKGFTKGIRFFAVLVFATLLSVTSVANVYNVTNTSDGLALNQLRGAILDADALGGTHTINVAAGTYVLTLGEIVFGNTAQNITIIGAGPANTIISMTTGDLKDRIFFINPSGTTNSPVITVQGIKFQNGYLTSDPYGGAAICAGGGSAESLTLTNCIFDNNILPAGAFGGAAVCMQVSGDLTVDNCTFTNNVSNDADGGAILFVMFSGYSGGDLSVINSTFTGNSVNYPGDGTSNGGAISFIGQGGVEIFNVTINKNTFISNTADGLGGAISANNAPNISTSEIHFNRFLNNTSATSALYSGLHFVESSGSVNAENNWWGCNTNPVSGASTAPCNQAGGDVAGGGSLDADPWLQLKVTASPTAICNTTPSTAGNTSTISASFLNNSDGTAIPLADLSALIGLPVTWGPANLGSLSGQQVTIQANGTATATFTSNGTGGTATVNAQVDNVPASETSPSRASITVNTSSTAPTGATGTTTICSGNSTVLTVTGGTKGLGATTEWFTGSCGGTLVFTGDEFTTPVLASNQTYYVRYTGACNTTDCATVTVTVNTLSTAPTGATGATTICSGSSTTLTVDGGSKGTGASTQWFTGSCGGTLVFTGDAFTTPTLSSGQTYYVRYSGTCNTTTCATVTITVNQRPTVNAPSVVQPTCNTSTGTITVNATGSGTLEYSVDGGASWFLSNVFSGLAPGNYNIAVRSQSAPACVTNFSGNPVVIVAATNCCTAACSNSNPTLYFGFPGDQTSTVTVVAAGGTAPYTVSITMNRPLNCNVITNSGDELWTAASGTSVNNVCPASGSASLAPVSTGNIPVAGGSYSVDVTLMQDATITATVTDATGCIRTCTTMIDAEDVRCFSGNSGVTKVGICHQTGNNNNPCMSICVLESSLADHLAHGDFVGNCTSNCIAQNQTRTATAETVAAEKDPVEKSSIEKGSIRKTPVKNAPGSAGVLRVRVIPNPSDSYFMLNVETGSSEKITLTIYDVLGRMVKHLENNDSQLIRFGEDLKAGSYMALVRQGVKTTTVKLVKQ
jgi:Fe-S cluster biogenesis protein NfuA